MEQLQGKCKNCLGCNRLEDPEFKEVYRCDNYIKIKKIKHKNILTNIRICDNIVTKKGEKYDK